MAEGGGTDSFTLVLNRQPTSNVTVTVTADADTAVAAGGNAAGTSATLTFTPQNWNVAQTVTVSAVDDADVEGAHSGSLGFAVASTDASYNGLAVAPLSVAITDNDQAPVGVVRAQLSVTPGGGINASTFNSNSFKLDNLSTGGHELTSFTIDLTNAVMAGWSSNRPVSPGTRRPRCSPSTPRSASPSWGPASAVDPTARAIAR